MIFVRYFVIVFLPIPHSTTDQTNTHGTQFYSLLFFPIASQPATDQRRRHINNRTHACMLTYTYSHLGRQSNGAELNVKPKKKNYNNNNNIVGFFLAVVYWLSFDKNDGTHQHTQTHTHSHMSRWHQHLAMWVIALLCL